MKIGIRVSALVREFLIAHAGLEFKRANELAERFDSQLIGADWLSTLNGTTFTRTVPLQEEAGS